MPLLYYLLTIIMTVLHDLLLLTPNSRSLPMVRIAPKHWSSCNEPRQAHAATICEHTCGVLESYADRCGENVNKVSGGDKEDSSSQASGMLTSLVIPWSMAAGRRSPPDISGEGAYKQHTSSLFMLSSATGQHARNYISAISNYVSVISDLVDSTTTYGVLHI